MRVLFVFVLCGFLGLYASLSDHAAGEPTSDGPSAPTVIDWEARGKKIVDLVHEHFYDPVKAREWAEANKDYAAGTTTSAEFAEKTHVVLAQLKTSHTNYYPSDEPESYGLAAIFAQVLQKDARLMPSIGADLTSKGFVRHIFIDGPAFKAGIKRGDKILLADGKPLHRVQSFNVAPGTSVKLSIQRKADSLPFDVRVVPRKIHPKEEWIEAQEKSARIITVDGKNVAYMQLISGAGTEHQDVLRDAIARVFSGADALVLDFRDGWGGCNPDFVNIFSSVPPLLQQVGRDGKTTQYDPQWRKPLVLLVNGGVRSGKEVVARTVQRHKLGKIVGERTAGAVVAGRPFVLDDQSVLFVAVADVRIDGERLEGIGVLPDVQVPELLPFAAGADPQLDRALKEAAASQ